MMSTFFILLILIAVVVSLIIYNHWPKIPLPIVFIIIGGVFSIIPIFHDFTFNPETFLFFVVAPLLYNEAQSASRYWIGRGAVNIVSLSIALVIVTVVAVGFTLHWLFPILPLALGLALSAIVTPTDASAVSAFASPNENFTTPFTILQNESLFNDASGFVAFDLAILAYLTGTFSPQEATEVFIVEFIGGLILGAVVGAVFHAVRSWLITSNDDSPVIMLTLEATVPFLVYFLAEQFKLSGILAVVAAGLVQGMENDNLQLTSSRMQLVRSNMWEIVEQALTGVIFTLLGLSLPTITIHLYQTHPGLLGLLILMGIALYLIKFVLRLFWSRFLVWMRVSSEHRWQDSWLMAVAGASGTISLSLAFLLPEIKGVEIDRNALIFVAAVVILISLGVAAIAVPKITAQTSDEQVKPLSQWVREMIMNAMNATRGDKEIHPAEVQIVVDTLSQQLHQNNHVNRRKTYHLYQLADAAERKAVKAMHDRKEMTDDEYKYYNEFLDLSIATLRNNPFRNFMLRIRFGIHSTRVYQDLETGQDMFFTSPILAEQYYWHRQFTEHGENIRPIEAAGFEALMDALKQYHHDQGNKTSVELHNVQRFYRERHRHINMANPDSTVVYQLFLSAFHTEYEYLQSELAKGDLSINTARELQQHIIFDEMAYIQNNESFIK